jgi:hypothetical protein
VAGVDAMAFVPVQALVMKRTRARRAMAVP